MTTKTEVPTSVHENRRDALLAWTGSGGHLYYASVRDADLWVVAATEAKARDAVTAHLCDSLTKLDRKQLWDAMREELDAIKSEPE